MDSPRYISLAVVQELEAKAREHAALLAEVANLSADLRHFGQTTHQAHHVGEPGTFETCNRGVCPGVRRALARAGALAEACNHE